MPGRVDAVDPDKHPQGTEAASFDSIGDLSARCFLSLGRHRILEIENDTIGRQRFYFLQGAGIGARHIKHAAARLDGHAGNCIGEEETIKGWGPPNTISADRSLARLAA